MTVPNRFQLWYEIREKRWLVLDACGGPSTFKTKKQVVAHMRKLRRLEREGGLKKWLPTAAVPEIDCATCKIGDRNGPSHKGSDRCANKGNPAIAAGGTVAHCTCRACF